MTPKTRRLAALSILLLAAFIVLWSPWSAGYPLSLQPERYAYYQDGSVEIEYVNEGGTLWIDQGSARVTECLSAAECTVTGIAGGSSSGERIKAERGDILTVFARCPGKEPGGIFDLKVILEYLSSTYASHEIRHMESGHLIGEAYAPGAPPAECVKSCREHYNYLPVL